MSKTPSNRSYSQVRKSNANTPYLTQQHHNSNYDLNGRNVIKKVKPVENLFRNIRVFKSLLTSIQKNMLDDLLGVDTTYKAKPLTPIKSINYSPVNGGGLLEQKDINHKDTKASVQQRPNSKSMNNLNQLNNFYQNKQNAQSIHTLTNGSQDLVDHKTKMKCLHLLNKYNHKLQDLNANLNTLVNDQVNCDLKLLSGDSSLPSKYEYKNGEYVMRLTTDVIHKIRLLLAICEKVYKINFKLTGTFNPIRMAKMSKYNLDENAKNSVDLHDDKADIGNEFFDFDDGSQILKQILRKKAKTVQLPKLLQRVDTKTANLKVANSKLSNNITDETDIGPFNMANEANNNISERLQPKQQQQQTLQQHEPVISNTPQPTNNKPANNVTNVNQQSIDVQTNIKKLSKQDSSDSFIQDTDCSSIISDSESMVYYGNTLGNMICHRYDIMLYCKVKWLEIFIGYLTTPSFYLSSYFEFNQTIPLLENTTIFRLLYNRCGTKYWILKFNSAAMPTKILIIIIFHREKIFSGENMKIWYLYWNIEII